VRESQPVREPPPARPPIPPAPQSSTARYGEYRDPPRSRREEPVLRGRSEPRL
jgi:hypothetical protein